MNIDGEINFHNYTKRENVVELDTATQKFVAKKILMEVKKIAKTKGISEDMAYLIYLGAAF